MNNKNSIIANYKQPVNYKKFADNWESINWNDDLIVCVECGQPHKRVDRDTIMRQDETGDWVCKICNWN